MNVDFGSINSKLHHVNKNIWFISYKQKCITFIAVNVPLNMQLKSQPSNLIAQTHTTAMLIILLKIANNCARGYSSTWALWVFFIFLRTHSFKYILNVYNYVQQIYLHSNHLWPNMCTICPDNVIDMFWKPWFTLKQTSNLSRDKKKKDLPSVEARSELTQDLQKSKKKKIISKS